VNSRHLNKLTEQFNDEISKLLNDFSKKYEEKAKTLESLNQHDDGIGKLLNSFSQKFTDDSAGLIKLIKQFETVAHQLLVSSHKDLESSVQDKS